MKDIFLLFFLVFATIVWVAVSISVLENRINMIETYIKRDLKIKTDKESE